MWRRPTSFRSLYGSVDIADIVKKMEENAGVSIVVLDACRDNPFLAQLAQAAPQTRSAAPARGLAVIKASGSGAIIAYSAADGDVASDGDGANSPYTASLLKRIAEPNVEVGLMFRRVAGDVDEGTGGDQKPEVLIRLTREFYMNPVAAETPTVTAEASVPPTTEAAAPPAPVGNVQIADAGAYAGEEEATPVEGDDAPKRGQAVPYPELLARLDFGRPGYIPTPTWTPPPAQSFEAAEPNDTFGSATAVAANADVRFTIAPRGEADWIYFRAESAGVLNFSTAMQPPEIDLCAAHPERRRHGRLRLDRIAARPAACSKAGTTSPRRAPTGWSFATTTTTRSPPRRSISSSLSRRRRTAMSRTTLRARRACLPRTARTA